MANAADWKGVDSFNAAPWAAPMGGVITPEEQTQIDLLNAANESGFNLDTNAHPNAQAKQLRNQNAALQVPQAGFGGMPFFGHPGGLGAVGWQHSPSLQSLMSAARNGYQQMGQMGILPFGNLMGFNPAQAAQYFVPWMYGTAQPGQMLGQGMMDMGYGGQ